MLPECLPCGHTHRWMGEGASRPPATDLPAGTVQLYASGCGKRATREAVPVSFWVSHGLEPGQGGPSPRGQEQKAEHSVRESLWAAGAETPQGRAAGSNVEGNFGDGTKGSWFGFAILTCKWICKYSTFLYYTYHMQSL